MALDVRDVVIPADEIEVEPTTLGSGRFGVVRAGLWLGQACAIKQIVPATEADARTKKRLEVEIAALMPHLLHPGILPLYGIVENLDGSLWLVLKRGKFGSLKNYRRSFGGGPMPLPEMLQVAKGIAAALCYLHSRKPRPIVYGQLRPGNIMISGSGDAMLDCEFGVVRSVLQMLTATETLRVSRGSTDSLDCAYITPPEEVLKPGSYQAAPAGDVFAFGMVLFEMCTGVQPWPGLTEMAVMGKLTRHERPEFPPAAAVPEQLATLIKSCWQDEPSSRPTARQIVTILSAAELALTGGRQVYAGTPSRLMGHAHSSGGGFAGGGTGAGEAGGDSARHHSVSPGPHSHAHTGAAAPATATATATATGVATGAAPAPASSPSSAGGAPASNRLSIPSFWKSSRGSTS